MNSRMVPGTRAARVGWATGVAAASACAVLGYSALSVRAAGAPADRPLVYSGVLEEDGKPVSGARMIAVKLHDAASGGAPRCAVGPDPTAVQAGRFSIGLDEECASAVHEVADLWVEIDVEGNTLLPRAKIAAVPYALEASRAADAAGALRDELNAMKNRLAALEQRAVPRVLVTRDPRGGCPGLYVAGEDLVTQTFSTHGLATVQASGNIIACTAGRHDLILYVDGIEVDRTLASPNGPGGDCWVGMFVEGVLEVGPGDHTVSLRGTAPDIYGCGASWGRIQTTLFE